MADTPERTPVDQLVDLFVYAPVGLAYEYKDVLPKLIKRGKSQVQIARFLGTMAAKQGQKTVEDKLEDAFDVASTSVAQGITDVGVRVGLAPDQRSDDTAQRSDDTAQRSADTGRGVSESTDDARGGEAVVADERPLPIAGYDDLTAKQIIALLPDLDAGQRARVKTYEGARRSRKTVMAKLRSLDEES